MEATYSTEELAEELGLAPHTLENWRTLGRGPKFTKVGGRIRYRESAVARYLDQQTFDRTPSPARKRAS